MAADTFDIQQLVNESGIARRTIYFYVQQGLLPPPRGAGLAAYYTGEHLLRLQLIPVFRSKGLRLDEIRERFNQMDEEQMRQALKSAPQEQAAANERFSGPKSSHRKEIENPDPSVILPQPAPVREVPPSPAGWGEQRYIHYSLPAGISLAAPENLSPLDRQRLNQLLQAARQIFSGSNTPFVYSNSPGSDPDGPGEAGPSSA